jgi:hypothetical protein
MSSSSRWMVGHGTSSSPIIQPQTSIPIISCRKQGDHSVEADGDVVELTVNGGTIHVPPRESNRTCRYREYPVANGESFRRRWYICSRAYGDRGRWVFKSRIQTQTESAWEFHPSTLIRREFHNSLKSGTEWAIWGSTNNRASPNCRCEEPGTKKS